MIESFHLKHYSFFNDSNVHKSMMLTSEDDRDNKKPSEYMTTIKTRVIDFDEVKKSYLKFHGMYKDNAKSVDALYMLNDKICLTEFKNGDFSSDEIIEKAMSSAMIFMDITGYKLSDFRKDSMFVLVYNPEVKRPNKRQLASSGKAHRAKAVYSMFKLEHLQNFCFSKIFELEKDDFDSFINERKIEAY